MERSTARGLALAGLTAVAILVACGGGDSSEVSGGELRGVVVAGSEGTRVFLDLNNNQAFDSGEPSSATTGSNGEFVLQVGPRTAGELASAMLVAELPQSSRDPEDAGLTLREAGRGAYTLMAPAAAFLIVDGFGKQRALPAVLSPLTTMVAAEVAFNGLTPAQARQAVQQDLGLGALDPLADYRPRSDARLRNIARAAAIALGEAADSSDYPRRRIATATARLKAQLPAVIKSLGLDQAAPQQVAVQSLRMALAAAPQPEISSAQRSTSSAGGSRFIVKLRDTTVNVQERGRNLAANHGGELHQVFSRAIRGYAITVAEDRVEAFLEEAQRDPEVEHVEPDLPVRISQTVQDNATWGLDRTDQRALPLSSTYSYSATGSGVRAYIVDTGILASHVEFEGRVASGFTSISDGGGTTDCNGHGTHVAGTVGGKTWGMAKGVTLVPVRVLGCDGSGLSSGVIAGLDWVLTNGARPAVANMSLGGGASLALDAALAQVVAGGISVVVAAGNSNANACDISPAREPSALTIGATTSIDARTSFSNFGTCVDLFGPGSDITSAGIRSNFATAVLSGTSMAAPHVTGLTALYLQAHPLAIPVTVGDAIKAAATTGKITNAGAGSPDALIYTVLSEAAPPPGPPISSPEPPISSPEPPISSPQPPISSPEPPISSPVPPPVLTPSISVAALSGHARLGRKGWNAVVTIAVKNQSGLLVPGVAVRGDFTVGGSRLGCTTAPNGTCIITSGNISSKTLQTRFGVTNLVLTGTAYNPALNAATSITILKP